MGLVPILHGVVDADGHLDFEETEYDRRRAHLTALAGQRVEIVIRRVPTPRSRRQNAYMHVLLRILHAYFDDRSVAELKHDLLGACFGWRKTAEGYDIPVQPYTSELSKDDMTTFINFVLVFGGERGIEWPAPGRWEVG